jgi:hypothetical protein
VAEKTQKKKPAPKFSIPKKGEKCEKFLRPENFFHKKSFRWKEEPDRGKGKAFVLVGCPRFARGKSGAQRAGDRTRKDPRSETRWNPAAPLGMQCTYVKNGQKAGLIAHAVVQRRVSGNCRTGYGKK